MNAHNYLYPYYPVITSKCDLEDLIIEALEADLQKFQESDMTQSIKLKGCLKTELKYVQSPPSSPKGRSRLQVIYAAKQQIIEKVAGRGRFLSTDLNKHKKQVFIENLNQYEFNSY